MRIQHNIMAMSAYRNYTNNVSAMQKNLEKLSSGYKINRAGDDAAGLAISEKMRAQITGLETAQKNAKDGISLVKTAEGALTEVHDMLNRMVELATQSANGTYDNDVDRAQMQKEMDQLRSEVDRIADSSNFNGIKLLDGSLDASAKIASTKEVITQDAQILADGQLGKDPQAGVYSVDLSKVSVRATEDGATITGGFFGQSVEITLSKGESLGGAELAHKFADYWNDPANNLTTVWEDQDLGFKLNATVEGEKLVFTMSDAPAKELKALFKDSDTAKFTYSNVTGNNAEEVHITEEKAAVDSTMGRMYGQAQFTLGTDVVLKDGTALTIGNETYVFAIGADSKYKDMDNVVDLTDKKTSTDATELAKVAAARLSTVAKDNSMFKVGATLGSGIVSITEKEGAVDYTKNNLAGANGKGSKGITGTGNKDATAKDWAGLVKTGTVDTSKMGKALTLQIGDTADDFNQLKVSVNDMHCKAMGIDGISIGDQDSAAKAVSAIKSAINYVSDVRGTLGATQNRLDHTMNNLSVMTENIQDAESTIRDVDVAEEMMAYTKNNILIQSAQAMLAQANQVPQGVLQLLG